MPTTRNTKAKTSRTSAAVASHLAVKPNSVDPTKTTDAEVTTVSRPILNLLEPEELAKYEKIIPGGAERILELAEQQAAHAQELESRQLETSAKLKLVRQIITFFLALGTGALGAALLLDGSELAGLLVIVIDAAALAAVSLYSKQN